VREKAGQADRDVAQQPGHSGSALGRQLLAGFLSGASEVVGLLIFVAIALFVGTLGPLLYDIASGLRGQLPFWTTLGQVLARSFATLPGFLWNGRWVIVGLGLVGLLLAFVTVQADRLGTPWRGMLSAVTALGIVGTIVFALQYGNREVLLTWLAAQPYLLSLQNVFLLSDTASLLIGLFVALIATYIIWGFWNWWYARWSRWLRVEQQQAPAPEPEAREESWQEYQARLHRSKRGLPEAAAEPAPSVGETRASRRWLWLLLALLLGTTLALFGAVTFYDLSGSQLGGGDLFVSPQAPEATATLDFGRAPRQAMISSINGQGVAAMTLGREQQATPMRSVDELKLTDIGTRAPPTVVDLAGLETGRYWLKIALRQGDGGQVRYMTLQGGGLWAQVASWLVGITAGAWLALAAVTMLELLAERGWLKMRSA
jgi:hypothetical protein